MHIYTTRQNEWWAPCSHNMIPLYVVQLRTALDCLSSAPLPTACREATSALFCQKLTLGTGYKAQRKENVDSMQAWQWGETLPSFVFPDTILVWEQHHGLPQPLAKSHNLAHCLLARGNTSLHCSSLQSLSNADFFFPVFSLEIVANASFACFSQSAEDWFTSRRSCQKN